MKRGKPLQAKTPMRKVSAKRKAYRASSEGKAAMDHMGKVKMLPCVICGAPGPNDAHHVIHDRYGTRKTSDWDVISLCEIHHRHPHPDAIHTDKAAWRDRWGPDYGFLETVAKALDGQRTGG